MAQMDRLPRPGETLIGHGFQTVAGGKGANQAVAAARAGGIVTFIGRVGRDTFGDQAIAALQAEKIDVRHVVRDATAPSGIAMILVGKDGQNSIAVAPGANAKLTAANLRQARSAFKKADVVILQLETPLATVTEAARLAVLNGARVILNPAPAQRLPPVLLKNIWLLTPNEHEAQVLTGIDVINESSAKKAAEKLRDQGVANVIITLGARGAYVLGETENGFIPAWRMRAVDTTGAGDIFNGALAVALAEGQPLLAAARFANAAAAISVTRAGAQAAAPRRAEIIRLQNNLRSPRSL